MDQNHAPEKRRPWEQAFLTALAQTGNMSAACRAAQIGRAAVYYMRRTHPEFEEKYQEAYEESLDLLELEARRRAHNGCDEPVIHQGRLCGIWVDAAGNVVPEGTEGARLIPLTVKKYSDTLLIFLLKGGRPEKFRDNFKVEHSGSISIDERRNRVSQLLASLRERAGIGGDGTPFEGVSNGSN